MLDNGIVIEKLHSLLGGVPFTPLEEDARTSPMTTTTGVQTAMMTALRFIPFNRRRSSVVLYDVQMRCHGYFARPGVLQRRAEKAIRRDNEPTEESNRPPQRHAVPARKHPVDAPNLHHHCPLRNRPRMSCAPVDGT